MKKLLYLLLLFPFVVEAQVNGTIQKNTTTKMIRGSFGSGGLDTLASVTGVLTNGYILKYNSTLNKWYAVADPVPAGLSDSLLNKANRNFNNVANGAIPIGKLSASTISGVNLGGNLANLSAGYGLSGTAYNGSASLSHSVDTTEIATSQALKDSLLNYMKRDFSNRSGSLAQSGVTGLVDSLNNVVHKTGNETISGIKTFNDSTAFQNSIYLGGNSRINGYVGIGALSSPTAAILIGKQSTGSSNHGVYVNSPLASSVNAFGFRVGRSTTGSVSVVTNIEFGSYGSTLSGGATIYKNRGFYVASTLNNATYNHGFEGNLMAGTNVWNLFMSGTARNFLAGRLMIGDSTRTTANEIFYVSGNATVKDTIASRTIIISGTGANPLTMERTGSSNSVAGKLTNSAGTTYWGRPTGGRFAVGPNNALDDAPYLFIDNSGNTILSGVPISPTATAGTNTTQIATTAFVTTAIAAIPVPTLAQVMSASNPANTPISILDNLFITKGANDDRSLGSRVQMNDNISPTRGLAIQLGTDGDILFDSFRSGSWNYRLRIDNENGDLKYENDLSSFYTDRSLVDKEYVDDEVSGITASSIGLGSVDNTSDLSKPISTATQNGLDLKANLASPALTGNPTAPTQIGGDNSTKIATTAYVDNAVSTGIETGTIAMSGNGSATLLDTGIEEFTTDIMVITATSSEAAKDCYLVRSAGTWQVQFIVAPANGSNNVTFNYHRK